MRGMIAVDDVIASLPKDRQKKIAARGNKLLAKIQRRMTLSEIRKGQKISQAKMAEALGIGQMQISGIGDQTELTLQEMHWSKEWGCVFFRISCDRIAFQAERVNTPQLLIALKRRSNVTTVHSVCDAKAAR
jgi:hypothetical protein